jgi:hypothetical protein
VTISTLCGGRRNFSLALTVSAHALLIEAPRSLAVGIVAAATGLPRPLTNLSGLAGPGTAPTTATLLSWVDPFALGFFALLGLGLLDTLKVQRRARAAMLLLLFVCALCLAQVAASAGLGSLPLNFNVSFERG